MTEEQHPPLDIDLGRGHKMSWWQHGGRSRAGIFLAHPIRPDDELCNRHNAVPGMCVGSIAFDIPENSDLAGDKWQILLLDPLTLSPSVACHCGDHGSIKLGQWKVACETG